MLNAGFEPQVSDTKSTADCPNASWQTNWAIEHQAKKTWTRQPVPMIREHSAHSTPLPVDDRNWVWRYTCLLLISMFWHRQAIYESKGDKLSSSAECRIRSWKHLGPLTTRYIIRDINHGKAMRERREKAGHYDDNMQITHINIIMTQISHFERYPVAIRSQYDKNSDAMLYLPVFSVNTSIQIIHMK